MIINLSAAENLVNLEAEPTAENLIIFIRNLIKEHLPEHIRLTHPKLYETKDSYAEWFEK
ncbi:MAG: 6-carboxytetrahydropterin synthase [Saprospiraceae bacterium]|nr:6-carboxytetrahydropterin synthase [Saprospiraceae bacterium]